MKKINLFIVAVFFALVSSAQATSDFENLSLGTDTFWTGSDLSGGFGSGHAYFKNVYDTTYRYWSAGFVYSNKTDSTTAGYANQYSAVTAGGFGGSHNYAVAYDDGAGNVKITLTQTAAGKAVQGVYVTNATYAYQSMLHGDSYEHAFDSSDFFLLTVTGFKNGVAGANTVNFYLADFRSPTNSQHYIVHNWQWVNLLSLGNVDSLKFSLSGSQNDSLGYLNTPAYFAIDNFVTSDLATIYDTLKYNQDTIINVLSNIADTAGGPFSVHIVGNTIPGASVVVDSADNIWYIPQQGINAVDTITYVICNNSNQCDTAQIVITVQGLDAIRRISDLQTKVYPNPFNNSFSVYHTADVKTVELYDLEGRLIRTIPCNAGEQITGIQTGDLTAGIYILKVISDQGVGVAKVTRQ